MIKNQDNNQNIITRLLDNEPVGMTVQVVRVMGDGAFRQRLLEMGFVRGARVTVLKNAPLKDPVEYMIMGSHISRGYAFPSISRMTPSFSHGPTGESETYSGELLAVR